LLDESTQQPTEIQPYRWDIYGRGGAQGDDDRGGRPPILSAIGFREKKIIKHNSTWLEADANQQLQTTTNHINRERWGKLGKDARPSGNAGGALFEHYGGIRIGNREVELGECKVIVK
jgi:hypothetical protein